MLSIKEASEKVVFSSEEGSSKNELKANLEAKDLEDYEAELLIYPVECNLEGRNWENKFETSQELNDLEESALEILAIAARKNVSLEKLIWWGHYW